MSRSGTEIAAAVVSDPEISSTPIPPRPIRTCVGRSDGGRVVYRGKGLRRVLPPRRPSAREDAVPVQGSGSAAALERELDKGMKEG